MRICRAVVCPISRKQPVPDGLTGTGTRLIDSNDDASLVRMLITQPSHDPINLPDIDSFFVLHQQMSPVILVYGTMPEIFVTEHNHGGRLMKDFMRLSAEQIPIRDLIDRQRGILHPADVHALNCWLRHGLRYFHAAQNRRIPGWNHRHAWKDVIDLLNLRFRR